MARSAKVRFQGIAVVLALAVCSCAVVHPGAGSVPRETWSSFDGEVVSGETFVKRLPNGFEFHFDWNGNNGSIEVVDPSGAAKDLCAVATPPYHGPNELMLWSEELLRTEEQARVSNRPGRKRFFHCLMTEQDRIEATWALFGWIDKPPFDKPAGENDRERAYQRYIVHANERCLSGWIDVVDIKDVRAGSGKDSSPVIGRMRFTAHFELPKGGGNSL